MSSSDAASGPSGCAPAFPEITINTDRLVLRAFDLDDAPSLAEMMNDELVHQWTTVPHPYAVADAESWVRGRSVGQRVSGDGLALAAVEFLTQRLVGTVRLRATDWRLRSTELQVVTAPWARGEGYAGEITHAVARWLFEDQKFERLELRTAAGNTAAQLVAQKLGAISEGILRNAWLVRGADAEHGSRSDLIVWSLLPEDLDPHWG
ncbi:GNAT family N-acetyltransferase [Streptacidiphilus jiangxiensis]|uniref:Protein N-acetyltransferase, RimJ/RimL family n=1 Tax=Streptacidiphilus jiangxiensis TaxID=235985 RepID=A0A1H7XGS5_STRJI|nr:GNAT family protein [Streptacidiphilus jiangxiensis]SEM32931.1 Protein N-acetyltransferase, RimJ/RimL family [Streptacidiphilus jiangxiensis]